MLKTYKSYILILSFILLIILLVNNFGYQEDKLNLAESVEDSYVEVSQNNIIEAPTEKTPEVTTPIVKKTENIKINTQATIPVIKTTENTTTNVPVAITTNSEYHKVTRVVDGDTIDVSINGVTERIRMIGINTPETVDPRKAVECFGTEASNQAKLLLSNKLVKLELDPSQGDRDKYSRLLRYIFLEDGTNFGLKMIQEGYAYEYTYDGSYKYQTEYKNAQKQAEDTKAGLWGDKCNGVTENTVITPSVAPTTLTNTTTETSQNNSCSIKGNINSKKEKIYHMFGCGSYNATIIDESAGEKWFCSEEDALNSGWRKALNC